MRKPVNVYDFDHTIYDGDASFDFIVYCLLRYPKTWIFLPKQFFAIIRYLLGLWNRKQVKQAAFAFLRVLPDTEPTVRSFWDTHHTKIKPWYLAQKHPSDLVISASPEFLLEPVAKELGIASLIATIIDTRTGVIIGENCRADEKVRRLRKYDPSIKIENCYSDSLSDMPLLKLAHNAYIIKKHSMTTLQDTPSLTASKKVLLYSLFAAIATGANLGAQWLVLRSGDTRITQYIALIVGTLVGMPIKYVLDKRWIFNFKSDGPAHDLRLFGLYLMMAVITTVIFWGSELAFGQATGSNAGRLVGGAIGLCVGYLVKYRLDKHFVFVRQEQLV